jgi:hypothetical protein
MPDRTDPELPRAGDLEGWKQRWVPVRFHTELWGRDGEGSGIVRSISSSGAIIEDATPPLVISGEARLKFSLLEGTLPIEIRVLVAREVDGATEVEFLEMNARTRKLLRMVVARAVSRAEDSDDPDDAPTLLSLVDKV